MPRISRAASEVPQWQQNQDRLRRAKSWHERSRCAVSDDEKFILLWIAFNAAYGGERTAPETKKFRRFLIQVVKHDTGNAIEQLLWGTFSGHVRVLLRNLYVFEPFWKAVWDLSKADVWEGRFWTANRIANSDLRRRHVDGVLKEVFSRLYTLRNQLVHGGATYGSGWGRPQLRDGCKIMASLVPAILEIMETDIEGNPESTTWGKVAYPRINYRPDN